MSRKFEVVIYTAAREDYADKMINMIDPGNQYVDHRLYRQNCVPYHGICVKDFRIVANRNAEDMIMIDNYVYSFAMNIENGIPIKPYASGGDDQELKYLADVLEKMSDAEKCADFIEKTFKLREFYSFLKHNK